MPCCLRPRTRGGGPRSSSRLLGRSGARRVGRLRARRGGRGRGGALRRGNRQGWGGGGDAAFVLRWPIALLQGRVRTDDRGRSMSRQTRPGGDGGGRPRGSVASGDVVEGAPLRGGRGKGSSGYRRGTRLCKTATGGGAALPRPRPPSAASRGSKNPSPWENGHRPSHPRRHRRHENRRGSCRHVSCAARQTEAAGETDAACPPYGRGGNGHHQQEHTVQAQRLMVSLVSCVTRE